MAANDTREVVNIPQAKETVHKSLNEKEGG